MNRGIQGLRISQVSLILIGLVCVTVLVLSWTKTTFLTAFIPSPNHVLQLDLDEAVPGENLKSYNLSYHTREKQVEPFAWSGGTEPAIARKNIDTDETTNKEENPTSDVKRWGSDELSEGKNKSFQVEIVMKNSSASDSSVRSEENGNLSTTTKNKESYPNVPEGAGFEEPSGGKDKEKESETVTDNSLSIRPSVEREQTVNLSATIGEKGCNYAKGKWVVDDNRPLYSGFGCNQWLSSMWACRLTQRKDFEYEKLRWQPQDCKMEEFTGPKFLQRMQDKTLAFIGDSLGRQQFQSLMCMVTGGEERADVVNVGHEYGLVKARGAVRPDGWAYRFPITNTTILFYWSVSLCDLEPINVSDPGTKIAMHVDRPPAFLRRFIHKFDVLVLNTGHHWNRGKLNANRWVIYVGGVPNTNKKLADLGGAKNLTIHSIVRWVDSQLPLHPGLKAYFRSLSPRHFVNGDWNSGGSCDSARPLSGGKLAGDSSSDPVVAGAVKGTNVKALDIKGLSEVREEGHISRYTLKATPGVQDCLHWCLPGIPDTWNEILFAHINPYPTF